jgi:peptidoglycan biosynthesis protein MviN/MurJ (putative lipid II flippase)
MPDLMAILTVGLQYWLIIAIVHLYSGKVLPLGTAAALFIILTGVGLAFWHKKESWKTARKWRRSILGSLIVGVAFFAIDWSLAYLNGQSNPFLYPGGLLGIPVTVAVCPGFTMICVAGLIRTLYLNRHAAKP